MHAVSTNQIADILHFNDNTDNSRFWTATTLFCTNKPKSCNKIKLNENDKKLKDVKEIKNKFNKYLANIAKRVNLKKNTGNSFESQESCR